MIEVVVRVARAFARGVLWPAWLSLFPLYLSDLMFRYPEYIPFPQSAAPWLFVQYRRFDPTEDGYNFEGLLCWLLAFTATLTASHAAIWLWRRHRRPKSAPPQP
ncbi:hypothetical protein [Cupriavidus campinensis]